MASERQAAQAAGMTGFCAKPVDFNKLDEEMARVLNIPLQQKKGGPLTAGQSGGLFDKEQGAALWGDSGTYMRELTLFSGRLTTQSMELHHQLERGEFESLATAAHSLKGLSGNLLLSTFTAVFDRLENAAGQQNFQDCCNSLDTISTLLRQLASELEKSGNTEAGVADTSCAGEVDLQAALAAVRKLMEAAERNSCDDKALSVLMAQETLLGAETLQLLDDAFCNFEFVAAQKTLQDINRRLGEETQL
jgi:HPt (histidine-containing phosphotransfer) domain-containing protein